jgi:uncharacterized membrane protein
MLSWSYLKTAGIVALILISLTTIAGANINNSSKDNVTVSFSNMSNSPQDNLNDSVSIVVTGNATFVSVAADNILSNPQPINIKSTSNVPVNIDVKALDWTSTNGNMPLSALQFGNSHTAMTTDDQNAITNLEPNSAQDVNLYIQIPFGSLPKNYSTTITWTASQVT